MSGKSILAHYFPYDVKLPLLANSRSFLANQKARNAIVGTENLLILNSLRGKEQCASQGRPFKKNLFPATCCGSGENRQSENEDSYIYVVLAVFESTNSQIDVVWSTSMLSLDDRYYGHFELFDMDERRIQPFTF